MLPDSMLRVCAAKMMEVLVNSSFKSFPEGITLMQALESMGLHLATGMAIALNEKVINQNQWTITLLNPQDRIIIIQATQGG